MQQLVPARGATPSASPQSRRSYRPAPLHACMAAELRLYRSGRVTTSVAFRHSSVILRHAFWRIGYLPEARWGVNTPDGHGRGL